MDPEALEDLLAELAIVNAASMTALKTIALAQPDPTAYLQGIHEGGLKALAATNYWSVPPERKEAFLAKVEARWTSLVTDIRVK